MITIGVLGGIGPEATGIFYLKLIAALQRDGAITRNQDFPRIVINSIPAPELVHDTASERDLLQYIEGIEMLDAENPSFIVMVCNTIHLYHDMLQSHSKAPILDLRLAVHEKLQEDGIACAGLLGTHLTIAKGLYHFPDISIITPSAAELDSLMQHVICYNRGEEKEMHVTATRDSVQRLMGRGAQRVILGCTEFAAMLQDTSLQKIDTIDVLADATTKRFMSLVAEE
jgi:aspartate racemase